MIEFLALGLAWLVLPLPFAILIGKCISVGQAGETVRHAADAATLKGMAASLELDAVSAEDQSTTTTVTAAFPTQRPPVTAVRKVS